MIPWSVCSSNGHTRLPFGGKICVDPLNNVLAGGIYGHHLAIRLNDPCSTVTQAIAIITPATCHYHSDNPVETRRVSATSSLQCASWSPWRYRCSCCTSFSCRRLSTNVPYTFGSGRWHREGPAETTSTFSSAFSAANCPTVFPNRKQFNIEHQISLHKCQHVNSLMAILPWLAVPIPEVCWSLLRYIVSIFYYALSTDSA